MANLFGDSLNQLRKVKVTFVLYEVLQWLLIQSFYSGLNELNMQILDASYDGNFLYRPLKKPGNYFNI